MRLVGTLESTRQRRGDYIQTFTGRKFWPLDPDPAAITLADIAHALSNQCRYSGHCRSFYCPTPDQRVLTTDLRWLPAGDLKVGDELLGFDEWATVPGSTGKARRRFRNAIVMHAEPVRRRVVRLEMADGSSVVASEEHPWLVATKVSRNQKWLTTRTIANDIARGRRRYMHRIVEPWSTLGGWEAGWLAGMADGEGYVSLGNRGGSQAGISQKPGPTLDRLMSRMSSMGFAFGSSRTGSGGTMSLQIAGGWRGIARFIGSVRPERLVATFAESVRRGDFAKQLSNQADPMEIVRSYDEGEEWVAGLETSTHTYICEGYGAHNSVAEHSVRVAWIVPRDVQRWGLLHDAAEAYLTDLTRPVKHLAEMKPYRDAEARMMAAVCTRFGLDPLEPPAVKVADNVLLATEVRDLMTPDRRVWRKWLTDITPLPIRIDPWSPAVARREFLALAAALGLE